MGDPRHEQLDAFGKAVRETYLTPPDEATESRHLAAMAAEARAVRDEPIPARASARGMKEALLSRFRTAALAVKLAALTLLAALATGGLATAGVISLPDSLPGVSSDRAKAVHEAIDGSDPTELDVGNAGQAEEAGQPEDRGKPESDDVEVEANENGATPEEGAGQAFGDSVSDRASGGEPKEGGREFGESVSEEAQELVPRPDPEPQGGPKTGETQSKAGRDIAESHGGGPPQDQ